MGMDPDRAYWMTPREVNLAMEGFRMREKKEWARTLRVTQMWGDEARVSDLFGGGPSYRQMSEGKYADLKRRMGYLGEDAQA